LIAGLIRFASGMVRSPSTRQLRIFQRRRHGTCLRSCGASIFAFSFAGQAARGRQEDAEPCRRIGLGRCSERPPAAQAGGVRISAKPPFCETIKFRSQYCSRSKEDSGHFHQKIPYVEMLDALIGPTGGFVHRDDDFRKIVRYGQQIAEFAFFDFFA